MIIKIINDVAIRFHDFISSILRAVGIGVEVITNRVLIDKPFFMMISEPKSINKNW
jgi:F0F1-type ATP synthase assembly protein I